MDLIKSSLAFELANVINPRLGKAITTARDLRLLRLQSAQILLVSSFSKLLIVCWFWAAWEGVARRDMTSRSVLEGVKEGETRDKETQEIRREK